MNKLPSLLAIALFLSACQAPSPADKEKEKNGQAPGKTAGTKKKEESSQFSLPFLLTMDFDEASAISAQKSEIPPYIKVAADSVEVLKRTPDGKPRKVRAKGHVFVQLDYAQQGRALCQEALISDEDVILRGSPVLQRGQSTLEGISDVTVFYVMGTRLRALGPHKVHNVSDMLRRPSPRMENAWKSGPNPLLPPLESDSVPDSVREEMRKAIEAETALQRSRMGVAPAFPNAKPGAGPNTNPLLPAMEIPDPKPPSDKKADEEKKP